MSPYSGRKRPRRETLESNFNVLAEKSVEFRREWNKISLKQRMSSQATPAFQLALTRALLDHHFGLTLKHIPSECLIPPVPNRWFYVEWIQRELMPLLSNANYFTSCPTISNRGLDVGTGSSCIYPLLAAKNYPSLFMVATDIDPCSLQSARINVEANGLSDRIQLVQVAPSNAQQDGDSPGGPLARSIDKIPMEYLFDFCMTNPPFFDSTPAPRADGRDRTPMTDSEGIYPGGEVGFVLDMIRDSIRFQQRICWYSAMLGKKASFSYLQKVLSELLGIGRVQSRECQVGTMTRWFLAWTYHTPVTTSPATLVVGGNALTAFSVEGCDANNPVQDVVKRLCDYFTSLTNATRHEIECILGEDEGTTHVLVTEKQNLNELLSKIDLPRRVIDGMDLLSILPLFRDATSFRMELTVKASKDKQENVVVSIISYKHAVRGSFLDKITIRMLEGEINRNNRKWKRYLKRNAA